LGSLNVSGGRVVDLLIFFGWSSSSIWLIPSEEFLEEILGAA
jgi:hypothetical protein